MGSYSFEILLLSTVDFLTPSALSPLPSKFNEIPMVVFLLPDCIHKIPSHYVVCVVMVTISLLKEL